MQQRRKPFKKRKRISTEAYAAKLRDNMTRAECRLWSRLKTKSFAVFESQAVVHGYIPDFYCDEVKLAVEIDGGVHRRAYNVRKDAHRDKILASYGVMVVRFTNEQVYEGLYNVLRQLENVVNVLRKASRRPVESFKREIG